MYDPRKPLEVPFLFVSILFLSWSFTRLSNETFRRFVSLELSEITVSNLPFFFQRAELYISLFVVIVLESFSSRLLLREDLLGLCIIETRISSLCDLPLLCCKPLLNAYAYDVYILLQAAPKIFNVYGSAPLAITL